MSKRIIEQALQNVIFANGMHYIALQGGNEDQFTIPMIQFIPNLFSQVNVPDPYGNYAIIDLVKYTGNDPPVKEWALEAKHYTPHQKKGLLDYLHWSVGGCIKDILKLVDCGFDKFYILQIQTQISNVRLLAGATYIDLRNTYQFFNIYLKSATIVGANGNIHRIVVQNRINELINYSQQNLDKSLIYGCSMHTIHCSVAQFHETIHYLISGPFYRANLLPRIQAQLGPNGPYKKMVGSPGQIPTWNVDVAIESDPNA